MKAIIILSSALAVGTSSSFAQLGQPSKLSVYTYQVDNEVYCNIKNGIPQSEAHFYSETWGGKLIKTVKLNAEGEISLAENNFSPAFVLNQKNNNTVSTAQSELIFLEAKEFVLEKLQLNTKEHRIQLSWKASVDPAKNISFEILKSINGSDYQVVSVLPAYNNVETSEYNFTEGMEDADVSYKIRVKNGKQETRYTSSVFSLSNKNLVRIYPTVIANDINIDILNNKTDVEYHITNMMGQKIKEGRLSKKNNKISVSELAAGNYLITVSGNDINSVQKIVKQ